MQRPDEAQIMAYVDGELDEAAVAEVERAVAADPVLARQVREIMDTNALLKAAFNAPMLEPVPERLLSPLGAQRPHPWRRPLARRVMAIAASVAALLVVGGGVAMNRGYELPYTITAQAQYNWLNGVVNYHQTFLGTAKDERLLVDVTAEDVDYLENWFSNRLKRDVRLPRLENSGYQLQGGRVLFMEQQPAAQFFYKQTDGDGLVSVTIAQTRRRDMEWTATKHNGLRVIYWRKNGYVYVFAGAVDKQLLHSIAANFPDDETKT